MNAAHQPGAYARVVERHAQRPFNVDARPEGFGARRTQEAGGTCSSGDFRITSDARPEVDSCYFDTGWTNYGFPVYTQNGVYDSIGQVTVFPYYDESENRDGVRARACVFNTESYHYSVCFLVCCVGSRLVSTYDSSSSIFCALDQAPGGINSACFALSLV